MEIRFAGPADVPGISHLIDTHARRAEVLPRPVKAIRDALPDFVVAVDAGRVVACGSLVHYSPLLAEVRSLTVDDTTKGNGYGRAVVHVLIEEARRRGISTLFALTRVTPFFLKLGFDLSDRTFFPEKIWRDCQLCPIQDRCDETAVVLHPVGEPQPQFSPVHCDAQLEGKGV